MDASTINGLLMPGAKYNTFIELQKAIDTYCESNNIKLFRSDSRKLKSAPCRVNPQVLEKAPDQLIYYSLTYSCVYGGRSFKNRSKEINPPKQACKFVIRVGLSKDCSFLEALKISDASEHNHTNDSYDTPKNKSGVSRRSNLNSNLQNSKFQDICDSLLPIGQKMHMVGIVKKLNDYRKNGLFCDTAILTKDGLLYAHSSILAMSCPKLTSLLNQNPFLRHQPNMIDLAKYDMSLVCQLLDFFYMGKLCMDYLEGIKELCSHLGVEFNVEKPSKNDEDNEDFQEIDNSKEVSKVINSNNDKSITNDTSSLNIINNNSIKGKTINNNDNHNTSKPNSDNKNVTYNIKTNNSNNVSFGERGSVGRPKHYDDFIMETDSDNINTDDDDDDDRDINDDVEDDDFIDNESNDNNSIVDNKSLIDNNINHNNICDKSNSINMHDIEKVNDTLNTLNCSNSSVINDVKKDIHVDTRNKDDIDSSQTMNENLINDTILEKMLVKNSFVYKKQLDSENMEVSCDVNEGYKISSNINNTLEYKGKELSDNEHNEINFKELEKNIINTKENNNSLTENIKNVLESNTKDNTDAVFNSEKFKLSSFESLIEKYISLEDETRSKARVRCKACFINISKKDKILHDIWKCRGTRKCIEKKII